MALTPVSTLPDVGPLVGSAWGLQECPATRRMVWSCGVAAAREVLAAHTVSGREAFIEGGRGWRAADIPGLVEGRFLRQWVPLGPFYSSIPRCNFLANEGQCCDRRLEPLRH